MTNICKKSIVLSIILLLIGVSIAPSTGNIIVINKLPCELIIDGPTLGIVGVPYTYILFLINPDCDDVYFCIYWGDETGEEWIGPYPSDEAVSVSHVWYESGNYTISAVAKCNDSQCYAILEVTIIDNQPPSAPNIDGPAVGRPGTHEWTFCATDPDGDNVSYYIEWDDGTSEGWTDFYPSGKEITRSHTYNHMADFVLSAKAKDIHEVIGPEGTLDIKISKNRDCGCNEVGDADLVKVERLLNRVEVYNKLLLVLSKHNPELREISEELLDIINSDSLWDFPIICYILNKTLNKLFAIDDAIIEWAESTEEGTLEHLIAVLCFWIYLTTIDSFIMTNIILISYILGCWEWPYPQWLQ